MIRVRTRGQSTALTIGLLGIAASLVLAGCAADDGDAAAPSAASSLPSAEGETDYPLELDSTFGSTTLDERPERIAVISPSTVDSDVLAALGVTPVLAPDTIANEPWMPSGILDGVETLWTAEAGAVPDAEQVAAAEPDLIVALQAPETLTQQGYDQYSAIAPVLASDPAELLSWEEISARLGDALDLRAAADGIVADVEASIEALAAANPQFEGLTAAHVHVYGEEYGASYFSFPGSGSAALLEGLGFELPEEASLFADDAAISEELIGRIDADVLLVTVTPSEEGADWFLDEPLFQAVPAVQDGRYAVSTPPEGETFAAFAWAIRMPSPLSVPWAAESLEQLANEAIG